MWGSMGFQALLLFSAPLPHYPLLFAFNILVWIGGLIGLGLVLSRWKSLSEELQYSLILFGGMFLGTEISILNAGSGQDHYFLQLAPFIAILSASLFCTISKTYRRGIVAGTLVLVALTVLASTPLLSVYGMMFSKAQAGQPLSQSRARAIADYLKEENTRHEPIYMMSDHLAYWYMGLTPLTPASTHPSNISKEDTLRPFLGNNVSTVGELKRILDQQPRFIAKPRIVWYLREQPGAQQYLDKQLTIHYKLVKNIQGILIYRRDS
jgi:hypothetical protein